MVQFLKFKFLFTFKLNFNGGSIKKNISKFGYFKKREKVIINKIVKFEVALLSKSILFIASCSFFCAKKYGPGWMDGWVDGGAGLSIAYSNQNQLLTWH